MKRKPIDAGTNGSVSKKVKEVVENSSDEENSLHEWNDSDEEDNEYDVEELLEVEEKDMSKKPAIGVQVPLESKKKNSQLYKPPSSQELNELRETETLFHSNLFRLQAEELISEAKVVKRASLDSWIQELTKFLLSLPDGDEHCIDDRDWFVSKGIHVPVNEFPENKGSFQFRKPANVSVIGSYPLQLLHKPNTVIDLAVEMPKEFFQREDCINHRYQIKRAMYLAFLAQSFPKCKDVQELKFTYLQNDHLKPILLVVPKQKISKKLQIAIHPHPPAGLFHLQRLRPSCCSVQPAWFFQDKKLGKETGTPRYNSSILADVNMTVNFKFLRENLPNSKGVRDGIVLLKMWARQRNLSRDLGGFSSFILTMYVAYLLRTKKLRHLMSSYQIARVTWLSLANSDWTTKGLTLSQEVVRHQPTVEQFHEAFEVVFVDPSGFLNICANMSKTTFFRVKHEAKLALQYLDDTREDAFDSLFLCSLPFAQTFDHLLVIDDNEALLHAAKKLGIWNDLLDTNNNVALAVTPKLVELLQSGLSKRIHLLDVERDLAPIWDVNSAPPTSSKISIGFLLNPEFCSSLLDKGPSPDSEEATQFIKFWGNRSEIRRFQDGSICEAVVWPGTTWADKRIVCKHIVQHIISSHLGISSDNMHYLGDTVDSLLHVQLDSASSNTISTGEEHAVSVLKVYDDLRKKLRKLKDLVLNVTSVQGISPVFRHAQVFPQPPFKALDTGRNNLDGNHEMFHFNKKSPPWIESLQVILRLETSGKWPEDYEAICRLKAAFHIQLASQLREQLYVTASAYSTHVLVMHGGHVFKLIVASHKEVASMKIRMTPSGVTKMVDTVETVALELLIKKLPKVSSALHGLQMQQSTYSATCRLAKRWVASQLLADYVSDIGIELIVAYLYLHPAPYTTPRSPQVGFLRFVRLLSSFDWKGSPLIVNLNDALTKEDYREIQSNFNTMRISLPAMCIAAPYDKLSSLWTRDLPNPVILHRLITLAHEARKVLEQQLSKPNFDFSYRTVFRPCLDPFDAIIFLNPERIPTNGLGIETDRRRWQGFPQEGKTCSYFPVVDFNPVKCYLNDLQESFGDLALFFYDHLGGNYIAVLWKPNAFQTQSFKVSQAANKRLIPNDGRPTMVTNAMAVLEDFTNLGDGLVKSVKVLTEKWK